MQRCNVLYSYKVFKFEQVRPKWLFLLFDINILNFLDKVWMKVDFYINLYTVCSKVWDY